MSRFAQLATLLVASAHAQAQIPPGLGSIIASARSAASAPTFTYANTSSSVAGAGLATPSSSGAAPVLATPYGYVSSSEAAPVLATPYGASSTAAPVLATPYVYSSSAVAGAQGIDTTCTESSLAGATITGYVQSSSMAAAAHPGPESYVTTVYCTTYTSSGTVVTETITTTCPYSEATNMMASATPSLSSYVTTYTTQGTVVTETVTTTCPESQATGMGGMGGSGAPSYAPAMSTGAGMPPLGPGPVVPSYSNAGSPPAVTTVTHVETTVSTVTVYHASETCQCDYSSNCPSASAQPNMMHSAPAYGPGPASHAGASFPVGTPIAPKPTSIAVTPMPYASATMSPNASAPGAYQSGMPSGIQAYTGAASINSFSAVSMAIAGVAALFIF